MREQCERLLELGASRNVDIQVMPTSQGAHAGINGPMVLLESPDHQHYAYEEGQSMSVLHADSATVSKLTQRFGMIRMQALNAEESARLIRGVADQW
jgi:hypothetical protein